MALRAQAAGWQGRASSTRFVCRVDAGKADTRVGTAHALRRRGLLFARSRPKPKFRKRKVKLIRPWPSLTTVPDPKAAFRWPLWISIRPRLAARSARWISQDGCRRVPAGYQAGGIQKPSRSNGGRIGGRLFPAGQAFPARTMAGFLIGALRSFMAALSALVGKPSLDQHVINTSWTILPLLCNRFRLRMNPSSTSTGASFGGAGAWS